MRCRRCLYEDVNIAYPIHLCTLYSCIFFSANSDTYDRTWAYVEDIGCRLEWQNDLTNIDHFQFRSVYESPLEKKLSQKKWKVIFRLVGQHVPKPKIKQIWPRFSMFCRNLGWNGQSCHTTVVFRTHTSEKPTYNTGTTNLQARPDSPSRSNFAQSFEKWTYSKVICEHEAKQGQQGNET